MRTLGRKAGLGLRVTLDPSEENRQQSPCTDNAWSSLTLLAEVIASRKAVLMESHFKSAPDAVPVGHGGNHPRVGLQGQPGHPASCQRGNLAGPSPIVVRRVEGA